MLKEKKFPVGVLRNQKLVLKESSKRSTSGDVLKLTTTFVVDINLEILEPVLDYDGEIMTLSKFCELTGVSLDDGMMYLKKEGYSLSFPLDDLGYIVEGTMQKRGNRVENMFTTLYLPCTLDDKGNILCKDISLNFPTGVRKQLAQANSSFVLSRI